MSDSSDSTPPASPLLAPTSSLPGALPTTDTQTPSTPLTPLAPVSTLQVRRRSERKRKHELTAEEWQDWYAGGGNQLAGRQPRTYTCDDCGQTYAKSAALAEHAKSHAPPSCMFGAP